MKRYLLLILVFIPIFFAPVSCDKTQSLSGPLTLEEAIEKTKPEWDKFDQVWAWKDPVPANSQMKIFLGSGKEYEESPDFESWLIVADTYPLANGGIHYRWYFVSINGGRTQTLDTTSGPYEDMPLDEYMPKVVVLKDKKFTYSPTQTKAASPGISQRSLNSSVNDWAIIISGGGIPQKNYERYWNDCSWIYRTLRQQYGYQKDHIFSLISDGTDPGLDMCVGVNQYASSSPDLDNDGFDDVQYAATLFNLNTVFTYLASNVQSGDNVFVYVIDHGGYDSIQSSSYICLWNNEILYPSALASLVNNINSGARIHFVLGQCNSGGFIPALSGNNRSVSTACTESQRSNGMSNNLYDEFVYHWTNAMAGWDPLASTTVNADNNHDGFVSFQEAFNYAKENDYFYLNSGIVLYPETPQYSSMPSLFGAHYDLNGNYSYVPIIQGGDNITSSYSNTYSLSELPSGATASWSVSLGLTNTSIGTGSTKSISNTYSSLPYAGAVLRMTSTYSGAVYTDSKNVSLWVPGNHSNSHLISAYAGEFMLWENIPGITNYSWGTDDPNLTITQQGYFIAPYEMNPGTDPAYEYVWVSFNNPLGELTTIIEQNNAY